MQKDVHRNAILGYFVGIDVASETLLAAVHGANSSWARPQQHQQQQQQQQ